MKHRLKAEATSAAMSLSAFGGLLNFFSGNLRRKALLFVVVLPDITGDSIVDLRDHYFAHRSWFFGFMLASAVFKANTPVAFTNGRSSTWWSDTNE